MIFDAFHFSALDLRARSHIKLKNLAFMRPEAIAKDAMVIPWQVATRNPFHK